jgi:hypothetical protein
MVGHLRWQALDTNLPGKVFRAKVPGGWFQPDGRIAARRARVHLLPGPEARVGGRLAALNELVGGELQFQTQQHAIGESCSRRRSALRFSTMKDLFTLR